MSETTGKDANSLRRIVRFCLLLMASWCVMTTGHESGHIVAGWLCGGKLQQASIAPWSLPFSVFAPDPYPLITLWGGPILGVLVPLLAASIVRRAWMWFIAHFCLLANGSYLACAWITGERYLDTARLLDAGTHPLTLALYCAMTIGVGYVGFRQACVAVLSPEKSKE
jgi:hypothetical protein